MIGTNYQTKGLQSGRKTRLTKTVVAEEGRTNSGNRVRDWSIKANLGTWRRDGEGNRALTNTQAEG